VCFFFSYSGILALSTRKTPRILTPILVAAYWALIRHDNGADDNVAAESIPPFDQETPSVCVANPFAHHAAV
jgi:hypothetical protein